MQHYCFNDYFTLTAQKADFTQTIYATDQGSGSLYGLTNVGATSVTQSDSTCAKTVSLEIYIESTKTWGDYDSYPDKATKWPYV
jgi:hypothetical protein